MADVAKWIKAVDCGSTTRGFNSRRSPILNRLKFFILLNNKFYLIRTTRILKIN